MLQIKLFLFMIAVLAFSACSSKKVDKEAGDLADLSEEAFVLEGDEDPFAIDESLEVGDDLVADLGSDSANMDDFNFDDLDSEGSSFETSGSEDDFGDFAGDDFDSGAFDDEMGVGSEGDAFAAADPAPTDEPIFSEPLQDSFADSAPVDDWTGSTDDTFQSTETSYVDEPERTWVPVKKIAELPFRKSGVLVNAVYLAREGDTIDSVSQKVFGSSDRSEELLAINPHFVGKDLKVGDKVYYNSPSRPNDEQSLLTYYEDIGLSPEFYMTQTGDNIRQVSSQLLGHPDSWKEVWATNFGVESKGELDGGMQLKYWSSATAESARMAAAPAPPPPPPAPPVTPPPPPPSDNFAANDDAFGDFGDDDMIAGQPPAEPDSMDMAQNDFDQIPPGDEFAEAGGAATGTIEPPPPPPPPPPAMTPPPAERSAAEASSDDSEQTLLMGLGALLLLGAVAMFIIRRKRSQRELDFNTATQTQIE